MLACRFAMDRYVQSQFVFLRVFSHFSLPSSSSIYLSNNTVNFLPLSLRATDKTKSDPFFLFGRFQRESDASIRIQLA